MLPSLPEYADWFLLTCQQKQEKIVKTLLAFSVLLLGIAFCISDVQAQAPMKDGTASHRERRYILTAKRTFKQRLSIAEARFIAQTEDEIAKKSKDRKKPYLLIDYLAWRTHYYKQLKANQGGPANTQTMPPVSWKGNNFAADCSVCGGTGLEQCSICGGSGKGGGGRGNCLTCRGTGLIKCHFCGGLGKL